VKRALWLSLAVVLVGQGRPVEARKGGTGGSKAGDAEPAEADLPSVDAIEKGAPAPASMSFPRGLPAAAAKAARGLAQPSSEQSAAPGSSGALHRRLEGAAVDLVPPGGLFGVDSNTAPEDEGDGRPMSTPEFHVVKKGDTLWSLCDSYFRDPWRWPRLWSQNPRITNPHWIFPGDVVRLQSPPAAGAEATAAAGEAAPSMGSHARRGPAASNALVLREIGFVEAKDLEVSGRITGSREEKIMLTSGDQAYLSFPKDRPLKAGERYTVFIADKQHPLRNPGGASDLGYIVRIYGDVVIDQISTDTTARGTLVDMMDSVERGVYVSPVVRQFRRVEPRPSAVNLQGQIVASLTPANMLASETFVVLSRGQADGVEVGNRTFAVRRTDGYLGVMEGWDHYDARYPIEVVGELLVVDVRANTSLAWISKTSKEIRVGEMIEMRKGH
jgi:hypothetical protein